MSLQHHVNKVNYRRHRVIIIATLTMPADVDGINIITGTMAALFYVVV